MVYYSPCNSDFKVLLVLRNKDGSYALPGTPNICFLTSLGEAFHGTATIANLSDKGSSYPAVFATNPTLMATNASEGRKLYDMMSSISFSGAMTMQLQLDSALQSNLSLIQSYESAGGKYTPTTQSPKFTALDLGLAIGVPLFCILVFCLVTYVFCAKRIRARCPRFARCANCECRKKQ